MHIVACVIDAFYIKLSIISQPETYEIDSRSYISFTRRINVNRIRNCTKKDCSVRKKKGKFVPEDMSILSRNSHNCSHRSSTCKTTWVLSHYKYSIFFFAQLISSTSNAHCFLYIFKIWLINIRVNIFKESYWVIQIEKN